jgi:hypothetical protein
VVGRTEVLPTVHYGTHWRLSLERHIKSIEKPRFN